MRKLIGTLAAVATIAAGAGCGAKIEYWSAPGTPTRINFGPDDKIFIMPVDIHVNGDKEALSAALFTGFFTAFGTAAVTGQPLKPLMEAAGIYNLSYAMAEGMVHGAFVHNEPIFDEDYAMIPELLGKLFGLLREQFDFPIRYIAVAHIDQRDHKVPNVAKLEVMGGLYDIEKNTYVNVIRFWKTVPEDTMAANVGFVAADIVNFLTCPSQAKECREQAPEKEAPAGSAAIEGLQIWTAPAAR